MLVSIKGFYNNGTIVLEEKPTVEKANVIVTLLEVNEYPEIKQRQQGVLKGKIKMSEDFNAPLDELKDYM